MTAPVVWTRARGQDAVRQRSDGLCEITGLRGDSFSHRQPASLGGSWSPSNGLRTSGDGTRGAHGWIEAHPTAAERLGWRVKSRQDPALVPAWLWTPTWRTLGRAEWAWWFVRDDGMWGMAGPEDAAAVGLPEVPAAPEWATPRWPGEESA